ncbi:MAG: NAD(P)H-hydrate epimerase [Bacteroidota bacterium]
MFVSETGIFVPAVTSAQMKEIDRIAVEETGPNLLQMMENAGSALAQSVIDMLGRDWRSAEILVYAGPGGNGGGGVCGARHLANRDARVSFHFSDPSRLTNESEFQLRILRSTSARGLSPSDLHSMKPDLIIDAIIGYGLDSRPRGAALELIRRIAGGRCPVLSLDVPSGVDATSGEHPGDFVKADRTVTLALPKTGLTHESAGEIFLADIGIPQEVYRRLGLKYTSPFNARSVIQIVATPADR